jgi:hypothetical protein
MLSKRNLKIEQRTFRSLKYDSCEVKAAEFGWRVLNNDGTSEARQMLAHVMA